MSERIKGEKGFLRFPGKFEKAVFRALLLAFICLSIFQTAENDSQKNVIKLKY